MNLIGTHAPLNEALHGLIARNANDVYGVALYAVDNEAEYVAPVSSINMRPSDNVNRFVDRVHRTKLKIGQSAAADFSLISDGKGQSRIFDTHTLSHFQVPNSNMVLQIVQDETDRAPFELDDASFTMRAAIGVGTVSESFNGQHDEIRSGISYKGDVMLRVANQLKAMRRDKTSLVFI
jgi:hypothetical protein